MLLMIITATIVNPFVSRILIDDKSFYNFVYLRIFTESGLRKQYLRSCKGQSLATFRDSSTRSYGHVDIPISLVKRINKVIVNVRFFVIPCGSVYIGILGQRFLKLLDVVASPVHLKMKYHEGSGKPVVITIDMCGR